jgi:hypothetical protein
MIIPIPLRLDILEWIAANQFDAGNLPMRDD